MVAGQQEATMGTVDKQGVVTLQEFRVSVGGQAFEVLI